MQAAKPVKPHFLDIQQRVKCVSQTHSRT